MTARETAVVIAPGRGTYGKAQLGSIIRQHGGDPVRAGWLARFDAARAARGQPTISALDGAAAFSPGLHLRGDVAAPLIYAATVLDFLAIDRTRFAITAVTGNSMGWYSALACGGAVSMDSGFAIADAMGVNSQAHPPGGQLLVAHGDANWQPVPGLRAAIMARVAAIAARPGHALALSIDLGGMLVLAGDQAGLAALRAEMPPTPAMEPLVLAGHGPFHTPLMQQSSDLARAALPTAWFTPPTVPLVDGRGALWRPVASDPARMWDYTFGHQITQPYDFTRAVQVAVLEHAPDRVILAGPGDTLGGAIAQALIAIRWRGLTSKADFAARQASDPVLLAMGRDDQRARVVAG